MTEQFANNAITTLNGTITSGALSLVVTSATAFPSSGNFRILIDSEIILVTSVSGTTFTITRAQESTTAATHSNGATITQIVTAGSLNQLKADAPGGWKTALDLDFTAQTTQTLSPDTTYTIGGLTFTKHNSANEASNCVLTNGTGITITPTSGTDIVNSTRSLPLLFLPLSQLSISNLDWSTAIRAWIYVSAANPGGNYDNSVLSFGTDSTDWNYNALRGFNGSQGLWLRRTINASSNNSGVYGVTLNNSSVQVISLTMDSTWGNIYHGNLTTWPGSTWPTTVRPMYSWTDGTGGVVDGFAGNAGTPGGLGVFFGAMRSGSVTAFASTFARLRIDYRL